MFFHSRPLILVLLCVISATTFAMDFGSLVSTMFTHLDNIANQYLDPESQESSESIERESNLLSNMPEDVLQASIFELLSDRDVDNIVRAHKYKYSSTAVSSAYRTLVKLSPETFFTVIGLNWGKYYNRLPWSIVRAKLHSDFNYFNILNVSFITQQEAAGLFSSLFLVLFNIYKSSSSIVLPDTGVPLPSSLWLYDKQVVMFIEYADRLTTCLQNLGNIIRDQQLLGWTDYPQQKRITLNQLQLMWDRFIDLIEGLFGNNSSPSWNTYMLPLIREGIVISESIRGIIDTPQTNRLSELYANIAVFLFAFHRVVQAHYSLLTDQLLNLRFKPEPIS